VNFRPDQVDIGRTLTGDADVSDPLSAVIGRVDNIIARRQLRIEEGCRKVTRSDRAIQLQPREFKLLELLMRHAGQVVTRTMLLENVWDYHFDPQTNVIDTHISNLRHKIDADFDRPLLKTVRGSGYRLSADD
jgi:two-component system OmpR family response regulator